MNEKDIQNEVADLAEAILQVANIGEALNASRLKQKAIILLLHDITKVKKSDITYVLNALTHLKEYVKWY